MAKSYYEVLDVAVASTMTEIRSAYRKLVLLHHPDRSSDPKSKALFLAASEAYETLGDKDRRRQYDERQAVEAKLRDGGGPNSSRRTAQPRSHATPSARVAEIRLDINRLNTLYSRGNFEEAEKLARSVIEQDRRQPVPYAVLGDLARMSGNKGEAVKMYAFAVQFDPRNPIYQQRYDELVYPPVAAARVAARTTAKRSEAKPRAMFGTLFGLGLIILACFYVIVAREQPIMPFIKFISTWTVGMIGMLFFSGVVLGACMTLDGLLGGYSSGTGSQFRVSPTVALATVAVVSFWGAVLMYLAVGWITRTFNVSTSRIIAAVAAGTCLLAIAGEASGSISGVEVFLWGGNLVYLGALCGWMVTDALRTAER